MKKILGAVVILLTVVGLAQGMKKEDPRMGLAFLVNNFGEPNNQPTQKKVVTDPFGNGHITSENMKTLGIIALYTKYTSMPPTLQLENGKLVKANTIYQNKIVKIAHLWARESQNREHKLFKASFPLATILSQAPRAE